MVKLPPSAPPSIEVLSAFSLIRYHTFSLCDIVDNAWLIQIGYYENGRKYQSLKEEGYMLPSYELQFKSHQALHLQYRVLDRQEENMLFRAPISEKAVNVLDVGTGNATLGY